LGFDIYIDESSGAGLMDENSLSQVVDQATNLAKDAAS